MDIHDCERCPCSTPEETHCPCLHETAPEPREDVAVAEGGAWRSCLCKAPSGHLWQGVPHDCEAVQRGEGDREPPAVTWTAPEPREDVHIGSADVSVSFPDERDTAVAEVGLTDAEWTRLRHAAGNHGNLGPIADEVERILGERERAAAVEALREAADEIKAGVLPSHPSSHYRDGFARAAQIVLDRADRRAER